MKAITDIDLFLYTHWSSYFFFFCLFACRIYYIQVKVCVISQNQRHGREHYDVTTLPLNLTQLER